MDAKDFQTSAPYVNYLSFNLLVCDLSEYHTESATVIIPVKRDKEADIVTAPALATSKGGIISMNLFS
jgi:hypothetical protein